MLLANKKVYYSTYLYFCHFYVSRNVYKLQFYYPMMRPENSCTNWKQKTLIEADNKSGSRVREREKNGEKLPVTVRIVMKMRNFR